MVFVILNEMTIKEGFRMNLQHLKYFDTLAREQHYTRASKLLNITQPSLSNAIANLEEELHVKLFEKKGRNVILTSPGKLFHQYVLDTLKTLDDGVQNMHQISLGNGVINFAFLQVLGIIYVPKLVKQFLEEYNDKQIDFVFHTSGSVSQDIIDGIKNEKYDLGIASYLPNEPTLEFQQIGNQELVAIVPLHHPLAEKDTCTLSELVPYPHIAFSRRSSIRAIIDDVFAKKNLTYSIAYEITVDQVIAGLVSQNLGISVIPDMALLSTLPIKKIKITDIDWQRQFYLITNKEASLTPVVQDFKQFILDNTNPQEFVV